MKEPRYKLCFPIGDWAGDGHERCEYFQVCSNKPLEYVQNVHFNIRSVTGIDLGTICNEYVEDTISPEMANKLQMIGCSVKANTTITPQQMMDIWLKLLMYTDPELRLRVIPDNAEFFCGPTKSGKYIGVIGYGLFCN